MGDSPKLPAFSFQMTEAKYEQWTRLVTFRVCFELISACNYAEHLKMPVALYVAQYIDRYYSYIINANLDNYFLFMKERGISGEITDCIKRFCLRQIAGRR